MGGGEKPISGDEPNLSGEFKVLKALVADALSKLPYSLQIGPEHIQDIRDLGESAIPALLELCRNSDKWEWTQAAAITAAGLIGDPAAIPVLLNLIEGPNVRMRSRAIAALAAIGTPAADVLRTLAFDPDLETRIKVISVVPALGSDQAFSIFTELLEQDLTPDVMSAIARALGNVDDARAAPLLERFAGYPSEILRQSALYGMLILNRPEASDCLERLFANANPDTRRKLLTALGKTHLLRSAPYIIRFTTSADPWDRITAINALIDLWTNDVIPNIEPLLEDSDSRVHYRAKQALRFLRGRHYG